MKTKFLENVRIVLKRKTELHFSYRNCGRTPEISDWQQHKKNLVVCFLGIVSPPLAYISIVSISSLNTHFLINYFFLQDDLAHDDIMILDTGDQVFLWMGPRCSEVEVKLSYKSAQVYIQNLRAKQPEKTRKLFLTIMGKESKRFTRCFHGWTSPSLKSVPK